MLENIEVLCHNCIKFQKSKIIYTDPFKLKQDYHDADIIFITHSHYDHFSEEDIKKVKKQDTVIMVTKDLYDRTIDLNFPKEKIVLVEPNQTYNVEEIEFSTIPAYNTNKQFHPKDNNWVGYIIKLDGQTYYVAGDTDITPENLQVSCDVAFVPVGGIYTMNSKEAADLINTIKPNVAIPVHYGCIVGTAQDAKDFKDLLKEEISCEILIK